MFTRRGPAYAYGFDDCSSRSSVRLRRRDPFLSPVQRPSRPLAICVAQPREPIILSLGTAPRAAAEPTRLGVSARSGGLISRTANRKTVPRR